MEEGLILRPMTRVDVSRVYEIECACFRSPWSKNALAGELRNSVANYLVLEKDGLIVGYAGMWVLFDEAHITNVAVMADHRKQGYGELIMRGMMDLALDKGATQMTLEVREHNVVAQRLYARLDFVQNGFRPRYYDDTGEGALLLWNRNIEETLLKPPTGKPTEKQEGNSPEKALQSAP